jgi:hypothetical protein
VAASSKREETAMTTKKKAAHATGTAIEGMEKLRRRSGFFIRPNARKWRMSRPASMADCGGIRR